MAKKVMLSADLVKRLKAVKIVAKTEDEAREKLLDALKKIGVEGMETENTTSLLDMVEGFGEIDETPEDEEEETDEETEEEEEELDEDKENDALAEEVAAESEEDEEGEDETPEDDEEETDEETEEEEEKPAPKKSAKKVAEKKVEKKAAEPKAAKKEEKKEETKKVGKKRGSAKLQPKTSAEDRDLFKEFNDIFPVDQFSYDPILYGMNIKNKGNNSKRSVVLFDSCTRMPDGSIKSHIYFSCLGKRLNVLEDNDIEYEICWNGAPFVRDVTFEEAREIIMKIYNEITGMVSKLDKKLGENRKKMIDNLQKSKKVVAAKKEKPAPKPEEVEDEVEEEEEDEVETPAPAPKKVEKKAAEPKLKKKVAPKKAATKKKK